ncbi:Uncharacterised protein [Bordetella pertussis]|nr:Uncharacterised protein [Bordetella pertussis]CPM05974.1 Uncharacterised protein [Bordetella pertussis]CPO35078.1 Uncharacterised protein [Bordetella pertussis]CPQ22831.1 Uncharacterised protein [Bordetella pertussis]
MAGEFFQAPGIGLAAFQQFPYPRHAQEIAPGQSAAPGLRRRTGPGLQAVEALDQQIQRTRLQV